MCRTHTTQHELSAIAPNFQWVHLFASLGFADIRVGATSADIVVELVRTCTLARMHAPPCAACTQAPAALKPSLPFAYTLDTYCARHVLRQIWKWRRAGFCRYTAAGLAGRTRANAALNTQHAIRNMQHATCNTPHATCSTHSQISKGVAGLCGGAAVAGLCGGAAASWLAGACVPLGMVGCDEPVFAADNRCVLAPCGTGPPLQAAGRNGRNGWFGR
jgi:hypothetical protein